MSSEMVLQQPARPGDLPRPRDLEHLVHANAEDLGKLVGGDDAPHCITLLVVYRLAGHDCRSSPSVIHLFEIPIPHRDGQMPALDDRNRGQTAATRAASADCGFSMIAINVAMAATVCRQQGTAVPKRSSQEGGVTDAMERRNLAPVNRHMPNAKANIAGNGNAFKR
jgi:hypothetical protein